MGCFVLFRGEYGSANTKIDIKRKKKELGWKKKELGLKKEKRLRKWEKGRLLKIERGIL